MRLYKLFILLVAVILCLGAEICPGYCFPIRGPEKALDSPAYKIRGTDYLPLVLICDAYGIDWKWDPASRMVDLSKGNSIVRLRVGEYKVYTNGALSLQERLVILYNGAVCIPSEFLRTVFNDLFSASSPTPSAQTAMGVGVLPPAASYYKIRKIVIDAGHGGYDPGAIGRDGIKEKYIVLDIAKRIKEQLETQGIQIVLTRDEDKFIPLWNRVDIANASGADLFVSIHANASRARRLKGFEVYYLSEAIDDNAQATAAAENAALDIKESSVYRHTNTLDAVLWDLELTENRREAIQLGNCILDNIDVGKRDIKCARFFVLKGVRMPAVLVEVGYITNADECSKLGWGEYRTEIADKVTRGILEYKRKFESTGGFSN